MISFNNDEKKKKKGKHLLNKIIFDIKLGNAIP